MYVFISFLVIKSDVFVKSALKIDGYNKNKMFKINTIKSFSFSYEKILFNKRTQLNLKQNFLVLTKCLGVYTMYIY